MLLTAIERLAAVGARPPRVEPLPEDPALAALVLAGRGTAWVVSGSPAEGRADLMAALDGARRLDLPLLEAQCLTVLGAACLMCGELSKAASLTAAASAALRGGGWHTPRRGNPRHEIADGPTSPARSSWRSRRTAGAAARARGRRGGRRGLRREKVQQLRTLAADRSNAVGGISMGRIWGEDLEIPYSGSPKVAPPHRHHRSDLRSVAQHPELIRRGSPPATRARTDLQRSAARDV